VVFMHHLVCSVRPNKLVAESETGKAPNRHISITDQM
jgi:hypothetical protein